MSALTSVALAAPHIAMLQVLCVSLLSIQQLRICFSSCVRSVAQSIALLLLAAQLHFL
jgi:hypothetical protein